MRERGAVLTGVSRRSCSEAHCFFSSRSLSGLKKDCGWREGEAGIGPGWARVGSRAGLAGTRGLLPTCCGRAAAEHAASEHHAPPARGCVVRTSLARSTQRVLGGLGLEARHFAPLTGSKALPSDGGAARRNATLLCSHASHEEAQMPSDSGPRRMSSPSRLSSSGRG